MLKFTVQSRRKKFKDKDDDEVQTMDHLTESSPHPPPPTTPTTPGSILTLSPVADTHPNSESTSSIPKQASGKDIKSTSVLRQTSVEERNRSSKSASSILKQASVEQAKPSSRSAFSILKRRKKPSEGAARRSRSLPRTRVVSFTFPDDEVAAESVQLEESILQDCRTKQSKTRESRSRSKKKSDSSSRSRSEGILQRNKLSGASASDTLRTGSNDEPKSSVNDSVSLPRAICSGAPTKVVCLEDKTNLLKHGIGAEHNERPIDIEYNENPIDVGCDENSVFVAYNENPVDVGYNERSVDVVYNEKPIDVGHLEGQVVIIPEPILVHKCSQCGQQHLDASTWNDICEKCMAQNRQKHVPSPFRRLATARKCKRQQSRRASLQNGISESDVASWSGSLASCSSCASERCSCSIPEDMNLTTDENMENHESNLLRTENLTPPSHTDNSQISIIACHKPVVSSSTGITCRRPESSQIVIQEYACNPIVDPSTLGDQTQDILNGIVDAKNHTCSELDIVGDIFVNTVVDDESYRTEKCSTVIPEDDVFDAPDLLRTTSDTNKHSDAVDLCKDSGIVDIYEDPDTSSADTESVCENRPRKCLSYSPVNNVRENQTLSNQDLYDTNHDSSIVSGYAKQDPLTKVSTMNAYNSLPRQRRSDDIMSEYNSKVLLSDSQPRSCDTLPRMRTKHSTLIIQDDADGNESVIQPCQDIKATSLNHITEKIDFLKRLNGLVSHSSTTSSNHDDFSSSDEDLDDSITLPASREVCSTFIRRFRSSLDSYRSERSSASSKTSDLSSMSHESSSRISGSGRSRRRACYQGQSATDSV